MKPRRIEQNRLLTLFDNPEEELALLRAVLEEKIQEVEQGKQTILIPRLSGLRLRLPEMPFHSTPELFLLIQGQLEFRFPHQTLTIQAGEGMIIPAGLPHAEVWRSDGNLPFLCSILMFGRPPILHHFGYRMDQTPSTLSTGHCSPLLKLDPHARNRLIQYLEDIAAIGQSTGKENVTQRGLLLAALGRLHASLTLLRSRDPSHLLVHRCEQLLETHFTRLDLSVKWLAKELGCTPDHLSRISKKKWGEGILEKIHRLRVDHAKGLLENLHYQIAEVAWATGFATPSYFNRVFRRQTGLTPSEYRQQFLHSR